MKHSKSALVLMELIIVILFFSLASTVCIQLFSKSHLLSKQTVNENHAVIHAQNLAECFLATEGNLAEMQVLLSHASEPSTNTNASDNTITLFFTKDWRASDETNASYYARLEASPEENGLICANITVASCESDVNESIYGLTVMHHIPERRGDHDR